MANPRQKTIKYLIESEFIQDQQTLVTLLQEKHQIQTTQAQVSRDLKILGISKKRVGDRLIYSLPEIDVYREILVLAITDIAHNECQIIVKTVPALAAFVADYLDASEQTSILATLAGENALFVTPVSIRNIKKTYEDVCKSLYFKPKD